MKHNIILDLDNTLIYSEPYNQFKKNFVKLSSKIMDFDFRNMDKDYIVFERPGLQDFLDFLFENCNVTVWSAGSKPYVLNIIHKNILTNNKRQLDWIFFSEHCDMSFNKSNKHKDLNLLYENPLLKNYTDKNTFIIDDHPKVLESNGENCIHIEPFNINNKDSEKDTILFDMIDTLKDKLSIS
jgi:TFIIF-interacting CTD phosphatase-like protein